MSVNIKTKEIMKRFPCHDLIPSLGHPLSHLDEHGCINAGDHYDDGHINILSDGKIIQWSEVDNCKKCIPLTECKCITSKELTIDETIAVLEKNYDGAIPVEVLQTMDELLGNECEEY